MNLLFVCTQNVARSPAAEAVCLELLASADRRARAFGGGSTGGEAAGSRPAAGRGPADPGANGSAGRGGRAAAHEVRSAGIAGNALRRLTTRDMAWADVVAVMEHAHLDYIRRHWPHHATKVRVLDVPDLYVPDEPELRRVLAARVRALLDDVGL